MFVSIEHIDQVTPHLTERIKVREKDGYTVIDYTFGAYILNEPVDCEFTQDS